MGEGNIDSDPLFLNTSSGDYHLLPDSPCIDAGDPNYVPEPNETDLDGNQRVISGLIDMGAYEFIPRIEVAMRLTPQVVNCRSKGKWIKAHLVLPEGIGINDVNANVQVWPESLNVIPQYVNIFINEDNLVEIEVTFNRADFSVSDSFDGTITIIGTLTTGQYFYGTDTIRIITNKQQQLTNFASQWLRTGPDLNADLDNSGHVDFKDFSIFANNWCDVCPE
ncbi:MAG: hypothetical protein FVQ79_08005 [Planctomycetes bacterium]|nr:hypothetical protein [Planctomycetota bacterium]